MEIVKLSIQVTEDDAELKRIEWLTQNLIKQLYDFDLEELYQPTTHSSLERTKGDPITIGAITLAIAVAGVPSLITFIQNWVGERRKVSIELPNGLKVEFVADKKLSADEIIALANKLKKI